jgi:hypothetical protein
MGFTELKAGLNYLFLSQNYDPHSANKQIFALQGSGGSGKTWDVIFFILTYCTNNRNQGKDILICRETYASCKKTVLKDFIKILKWKGMYDKSLHKESHPQQYYLEGNTISFAGRDESQSHGDRNDLIYFNEIMLDDDEKAFMQLNQRCREVSICDYNPIFSVHWLYDKVISRDDAKFFKSTFLTNKFLHEGERQEKLAFEPTHPEDRNLSDAITLDGKKIRGDFVCHNNRSFIITREENKRTLEVKPDSVNRVPFKEMRPHPTNIANGTADEYQWLVYGCGEAAAAEGIIFPYVDWIDEFPQEMSFIQTMDHGFTIDDCCITKYAEDDKNIWIEPLSMHPMETPEEVDEYATGIGMNKRNRTVADSSDRHVSENKGLIEMVKGLRDLGWNIRKIKKTKSIMYWLNSMKKKKIHIVKNEFYKKVKKQQENYRMKTINGISINQPIDKFNHIWDSARYGHILHNDPQRKAFWD